MSVTRLETPHSKSLAANKLSFQDRISKQSAYIHSNRRPRKDKVFSLKVGALGNCGAAPWWGKSEENKTAGPNKLRALGAQAALRTTQRAQSWAQMPKISHKLHKKKFICTQTCSLQYQFYAEVLGWYFLSSFRVVPQYIGCVCESCHSSLPATSGFCMSRTILFFSGVSLAAPFWEMPGGTMPRSTCQLISEDWALCHLN